MCAHDQLTERQAKPRQSVKWGGDLREAQVDVTLSAIPAFDSIAGLCTRHVNSNRAIRLR